MSLETVFKRGVLNVVIDLAISVPVGLYLSSGAEPVTRVMAVGLCLAALLAARFALWVRRVLVDVLAFWWGKRGIMRNFMLLARHNDWPFVPDAVTHDDYFRAAIADEKTARTALISIAEARGYVSGYRTANPVSSMGIAVLFDEFVGEYQMHLAERTTRSDP